MAIHSGADANFNDTIGAAKSDVDIADAITKKHDGAAQDAVTATKTTLTAVKADSDVSSAISLKHTQNTDTGTSSASFLIIGTAAGRTLIDLFSHYRLDMFVKRGIFLNRGLVS